MSNLRKSNYNIFQDVCSPYAVQVLARGVGASVRSRFARRSVLETKVGRSVSGA